MRFPVALLCGLVASQTLDDASTLGVRDLAETPENGAPSVTQFYDHIGQSFVRKALDRLDEKLKAGTDDNEDDDDDDDDDDEEEEKITPAAAVARQPVFTRRKKVSPIAVLPDEAIVQNEEIISGSEALEEEQLADPMVPVDLNVNEGVDMEMPLATEESTVGTDTIITVANVRMIGSAAAGIGVLGSVGYCMINRRRRHRHSRSELPKYNDVPTYSTDVPRLGRRGLAKYR